MVEIILVQFKRLVGDGVFTPLPKSEIKTLINEINENIIKADAAIKKKMFYTARDYIDQCIDLDIRLEQLYDMEI